MSLTGFFGGPIGGTSLDIPDDRQELLVPIPARGQWITAKEYGSTWIVAPDGPRLLTNDSTPQLETARYRRQHYWWPLGHHPITDAPVRWEGSCMVHEDMRPTGVGLGLALVAYLTGYARIDLLTVAMGEKRWPDGAMYDVNRNCRVKGETT